MKKANLKKITLGIAMALGCNLMTLGLANNVEAAEFDVPIAGIDATTNATYADAGILVDGKYVFADAETTLNKGGTVTLGGWVAGSVNAVISNNNPDQNLVIDLQGNDLNINSSQTGITAGKNAKIDIYNPGKITIDTNSNTMAAAFFVKTGGHIHVHNGGENGEPASWDNAVVIRTHSSSSSSGVGIKGMSDDSNPDWIKIDGLVDIEGNVAKGQGMGEGLSAVASTIEVGGGKIIMKNDGTGETNFGGSNQIAIRAYGEFASEDGGIVNVNVTKAEDTYNSAATGAGNNVTQIVGNFSTVGGMGTLGTINVGLNTEDSYWRGNYNAGSGWGVTPGDFGCLNLWMGNGAQWEGYTQYATNLYMDTGATWYGYSHNNDNVIMTLKNGAMWTPTTAGTSTLTNSKIREFTGAVGEEAAGSIYMSDANAVDVTFGQYNGTTNFVYAADVENGVVKGGNITINAAGENAKAVLFAENIDNDKAIDGYVASLNDKLTYAAEDENLTKEIQIAEGNVLGEITATVDEEGNVVKTEKANVKNQQVSEISSVALMGWRAGMNDMNKRLGELRDSKGDLGVWVRMINGETEYQGVENEFKTYQIGYDEKLSVDPSWTVGVALSYTEGDANSANVTTESKSKGLHVYGSKLNNDGSFVDLIARYERLENDFNVASDKGSWDANGYSVSAEYGKRFTKDNGLWVEPQVELTYGNVGEAKYNVGSRNVIQEDMQSVVGRVGFSLGKDLSKGNIYARASYLYDFDGEAQVNFVNGSTSRTVEQDLGGGWWEVGVGTNINISDATHLYFDLEKTFGGEVDTNWKWNLGLRYSF